MQQGLLNNLTVFPVPGREQETSAKLAQQQQMIRDEAYQQGYQAGREEAGTEFSNKETALENVAQEMTAQLDHAIQQIEASHRRALLQVLETVLPVLADDQALHQIMEIIAEITSSKLAGQIVVQVAPDMIQEMTVRLQETSFAEHLSLIPAEGNTNLEVCLVWDEGAAEINVHEITERCLAILREPETPEAGG